MNNARAQAELFYDNTNSTYTGVCTAAGGVAPMLTGVTNAGGTPLCSATVATAYRISSILKSPSPTAYYCVDNTGKAEVTTTAPSGDACP